MVGEFEVWAQVLEAGARRWERVAESLWDSADQLAEMSGLVVDDVECSDQLWSMSGECVEAATEAQGWADHLRLLLTDVAEVETDVVRDLLHAWRRLW